MIIYIKIISNKIKKLFNNMSSNVNFSLFVNPKWKNSEIYQALSSKYFTL